MFSLSDGERVSTECIDPTGKKYVNMVIHFNSQQEALDYTKRYIDHLQQQ